MGRERDDGDRRRPERARARAGGRAVDARASLGCTRDVLDERSGTFTTYHYTNPAAHISDPANVPLRLPAVVDLTTTITVGDAGQFAAGAVSVSAPNLSDTISVTVDSYDHPVTITAPPARLVSAVTDAVRRRVFGTAGGWLNRLLTPGGIASLFTIRVT